ncbi:MAG: hypothetical protein ACK5JR_08610 [Tropicimonas sp.]|uniref:hypothetical protein n=1 Tax=Tropicimonas sp. TaxID=2067044 RepID=UPI003A8B2110
MKRALGLPVLALWLSVTATVAEADYLARNRMIAAGIPAKAGFFEVFQRATAGPPDYFCVAGEYVRYGLRLTASTDIYVVRGMGPSVTRPGRRSVVFSYVKYDDIPDMSAAEKGYSVSISRPGYFLSAGHSAAFCDASRRRFRRSGLAF